MDDVVDDSDDNEETEVDTENETENDEDEKGRKTQVTLKAFWSLMSRWRSSRFHILALLPVVWAFLRPEVCWMRRTGLRDGIMGCCIMILVLLIEIEGAHLSGCGSPYTKPTSPRHKTQV